MCGILGIIGKENCVEEAVNSFEVMKNRGKDCFGVSDGKRTLYSKNYNSLKKFSKGLKSNIVLMHNLHSLIGLQKQPIESRFVTNCEIYNYKDFKLDESDSKTLYLLLKDNLRNIEKIRGSYAFAYLKNDKIILARDILGIKPLFYGKNKDKIAFASEGKVLKKLGMVPLQLNPREIAFIDLKNKKIRFKKRKFFSLKSKNKNEKTIVKKIKKLLLESVRIRLPKQKLGILFSGGIDSVMLAFLCKKIGKNVTCYVSAFKGENLQESKDLIFARKAAKYLGIVLKEKIVDIKETEKYIKKIANLIESRDVVKVGCALPFYISSESAKKDGCKVLFSGLGSDEIFGGYESHKKASDINKECIKRLKTLYENDLYRDDVVTMANTIELRLPFLDIELIDYALQIDPKLKIKGDIKKYILRKVALSLGINKEFAFRKKLAAQYGSNFDKAIKKLSKQYGFETKGDYLQIIKP